MYLPVGTSSYEISSPFGDHHGIDYAVPLGTSIIAVVSGTVERASFVTRPDGSPSYGNLVVIRDETGNRHYYAHLSRFAVQPGQRVRAGQQIGSSGATGRVTGPHLHYEVRGRNGAQINPSEFTGDQIVSGSQSFDAPSVQRVEGRFVPRLPTLEDYDLIGAVQGILGLKDDELSSLHTTLRLAADDFTKTQSQAIQALGAFNGD